MTMSNMVMTFQSTTMTPLYSTAWTPSTQGQYAGTCIFLIVLAVLFRVMLTGKILQESRWLEQERKRTYKIASASASATGSASSLKNEGKGGENDKEDSKVPAATQDSLAITPPVAVIRDSASRFRPWRLTVDPVRAAMDTVLAGVGYLL
jgi:hypothetical protein